MKRLSAIALVLMTSLATADLAVAERGAIGSQVRELPNGELVAVSVTKLLDAMPNTAYTVQIALSDGFELVAQGIGTVDPDNPEFKDVDAGSYRFFISLDPDTDTLVSKLRVFTQEIRPGPQYQFSISVSEPMEPRPRQVLVGNSTVSFLD